jgi:prefoldin subunit 5
MSYPHTMDHLEVLRAKIGRLRVEIAEIQRLNEQYRRGDGNETEAQVAHGHRHERLQAIQQELGQLAALGRRVQSIEEAKEEHRSRLHVVKKVS